MISRKEGYDEVFCVAMGRLLQQHNSGAHPSAKGESLPLTCAWLPVVCGRETVGHVKKGPDTSPLHKGKT